MSGKKYPDIMSGKFSPYIGIFPIKNANVGKKISRHNVGKKTAIFTAEKCQCRGLKFPTLNVGSYVSRHFKLFSMSGKAIPDIMSGIVIPDIMPMSEKTMPGMIDVGNLNARHKQRRGWLGSRPSMPTHSMGDSAHVPARQVVTWAARVGMRVAIKQPQTYFT